MTPGTTTLNGTTVQWTPKTPAMMRSHLLTTEKLLQSGSINNLKQHLGTAKAEKLAKPNASTLKRKKIDFTRSFKDTPLQEQEAWIIEDLLYVLMGMDGEYIRVFPGTKINGDASFEYAIETNLGNLNYSLNNHPCSLFVSDPRHFPSRIGRQNYACSNGFPKRLVLHRVPFLIQVWSCEPRTLCCR